MKMSSTRGRLAFWALAGVALLVSHDAIFLAQMGPGEHLTRSLRSAGHDYWGLASIALALLGLAAAAGVLLHVRRLRIRAAGLGARPEPARVGYFARALSCWARLFAVVAIGFVIQESIEHGFTHGHIIGLDALLGPEYPLALPVIGVVTMLAGLVAAALTGVVRELVATITEAIRRLRDRAPRRLVRPPLSLSLQRRTVLVHANAGRAPPELLALHL